MYAWDQTIAATQDEAIAAVSRVCNRYTESEEQVYQLVAQEERVMRDLYEVWSVQVRLGKSVAAGLKAAVDDKLRSLTDQARQASERHDREIAALKRAQPAGRGNGGKQPFSPRPQHLDWKRGAVDERDRDRGADARKGGLRFRSRSRSRSPRRDGGGKPAGGAGRGGGRPEGQPRVVVQKQGGRGVEKLGCPFKWGFKGCRFEDGECRYSHDEKDRPRSTR